MQAKLPKTHLPMLKVFHDCR